MENPTIHAALFRIEELLLESVYESVSRARPDVRPDEIRDDEIMRAYREGFDDCLEIFWNKIQERAEVNHIHIARMEAQWGH